MKIHPFFCIAALSALMQGIVCAEPAGSTTKPLPIEKFSHTEQFEVMLGNMVDLGLNAHDGTITFRNIADGAVYRCTLDGGSNESKLLASTALLSEFRRADKISFLAVVVGEKSPRIIQPISLELHFERLH